MRFHISGQKRLLNQSKYGIMKTMQDNRSRERTKSRGSDSDAQTITGARTKLPARTKKDKVPPTTVSTLGASHNPELMYQVQDEDGNVRTYFETHPLGNRKTRRYRSRHHPYFTKTRTGGRDWEITLRDLSRERSQEQSSPPSE